LTRVRFRIKGEQAWITTECIGTAEEFKDDLEMMMMNKEFDVEEIEMVLVQCSHESTCDPKYRKTCPHAKPHYPSSDFITDVELCTKNPIQCNAGSDGNVMCQKIN